MWLLLVHPLLGTWPAIQACALTGNPTGDQAGFGSQAGTQLFTEPHQPGPYVNFTERTITKCRINKPVEKSGRNISPQKHLSGQSDLFFFKIVTMGMYL